MLVPPNVFLQYIMLSKLFQAAAALRLRKKRLLRQINTDAGEVRKTISGVFIMKQENSINLLISILIDKMK